MAVNAIQRLHVLPPMAIARLGESPLPMENFTVSPDPDSPPAPPDPAAAAGTRTLSSAPTLQVDLGTGRITGVTTPSDVRFRDAQGRIKPVAPFLEVWAQFTAGGPLEPLTREHVDDLGAAVEWRVHVANLKAFRRTGDPGDQVHAIVDWFGDNATKPLRGVATNFKSGKSIPFGSLQFLDATSPGFPELRLRFTPGAGLVFGPRPPAEDPNVNDDVYDGNSGGWLGFFEDRPGAPPSTIPGQIYYGHSEGQGQDDQIWVSNGYLDDSCDGIVTVRITFGGTTLTAFARIAVGPPTFAPDTYHVRTVADELDQIAFGPVAGTQLDPGRVIDIIRRSGEMVRMMNTAAMNDNFPDQPVSNMARHDTGWGRARQPIFPRGVADHAIVSDIHAGVLERAASGDLAGIADIQRAHDAAGNLSNRGRRRMPGMMRGSDGHHLALTRRQVDLLRKAEMAESRGLIHSAAPLAPLSPEMQMHALIDHFLARRGRHLGIEIDDEHTLADLFDDKAALLEYLRKARAKGPRSGSLEGHPLVVAGDPERSALVLLIRMPSHPMHIPFTTSPVGDTGKTGIEIVEEWIRSL